jgi:hypothetical protein
MLREKDTNEIEVQRLEYKLSVISISENGNWDNIVKGFKKHDVYYLSNYVKAFEIHGDGKPTLFYYEDKNIRAMNVVMKRDIALDQRFTEKVPLNTYFDIATPYGYGGFLIEGEVTEESLKTLDYAYNTKCKNEGIISEFVRFHPVLNNSQDLSYIYDISILGKTIRMELDSQEQIWGNLSSKNRNVIRKAVKSGVEIYWGREPKLLKEFMKLYTATMDKDNAKDYYYFKNDFYNSILNDLKFNSLIFYAVYEDKIIAMSMILFINDQVHYHLSASDREYQHLAPTNLLLFEAACWGQENGYRTFHLGGGLGSKEDSLYKFKKAFNKNSDTIFIIGKKIFNEEQYNKLIQIRCEDNNYNNDTLFFPKYRG